jgi:hypothetical protein
MTNVDQEHDGDNKEDENRVVEIFNSSKRLVPYIWLHNRIWRVTTMTLLVS